jgi:Ca-activated chloride channel homolog
MSFGSPLLLLALLAVPLAVAAYVLAGRRRMRYAVRYTNVDVLTSVAGGRQWRRLVPPALFLLAVATLCVAVARPRVNVLRPDERATIVLVLDVSGSMQANDVKPSRLAAAQAAVHEFLKRVPSRVKLGLVLFAGEPEVATPPTSDHELVAQAVDAAGVQFGSGGGTAIGDAVAAAVRLGLSSAGVQGSRGLAGYHRVAAPAPSSTLVSILFLSDGHQTRGTLAPLQGARVAKRAGVPVYTVALGTQGGRITNFPFFGGGNFGSATGLRQALAPDPKTLHAIASATGGQFFNARSAGAAKAAYARLGSSLGRKEGRNEVTFAFILGAAVLLVVALGLGALWAPRLP